LQDQKLLAELRQKKEQLEKFVLKLQADYKATNNLNTKASITEEQNQTNQQIVENQKLQDGFYCPLPLAISQGPLHLGRFGMVEVGHQRFKVAVKDPAGQYLTSGWYVVTSPRANLNPIFFALT
jgi:hypothetical protein